MFYFPQNVIYFSVVSIYAINTFLNNHALKFKYPPWMDKVMM